MPELQIPLGWTRTNLAALGEYINGFAFSERHWSKDGLPIIRIAQITGTQEIVDRFSGALPDAYRLESNDLIFSWSGTLAVIKWQGGSAWLNQHLFKVIPAPAVEQQFLFHLLQRSVAEIDKRAHGSTMKHIKRSELREFVVVVPDALAEQASLASILNTVDTIIRQTEAVIDKLMQVKQGLLHDLLTRGIEVNGELRPSQNQSPHLYKDSPLGPVPEEWSVVGLADMASDSRTVLRTGPFGSSLKGEHFTEFGRPVVTIGSLGVGKFVEDALLYVSEATAQSLKEFELIPGDIAFSRVADVGRSVVVEEPQRGWIMSSNFMRIAVDTAKVHPNFLQMTLAFDARLRRQMSSTINSAGRDVASSAIMMNLRFALPREDEQLRIMARMRAFDVRIKSEQDGLHKLVALRTGLMEDLLTGRVRVTSLPDPRDA